MLKEFYNLANNIKNNIQTEDEDQIIDLSNEQVTAFIPKYGIDVCPWMNCNKLGSVEVNVKSSYKLGDRVKVKFIGGNPRNNFSKVNS